MTSSCIISTDVIWEVDLLLNVSDNDCDTGDQHYKLLFNFAYRMIYLTNQETPFSLNATS